MSASRLGLHTVVAFTCVAAFAACSATGSSPHFTGAGGSSAESSGAGAGSSTGALTTSSTGGSTGNGISVGSTTGSSMGSGGGGVSSAYAHTATTLFKIDPNNPAAPPVQIGDFDCLGSGTGQDYSMTDIAVNANGDLWGISSHYVYPLQISGSTVHCVNSYALNAPKGVVFYGLTFAPTGVLGSGEVLVGANTAGELYSIEQSGNTITLTQHGTFGTVPATDGRGHNMMYPNTAWELSGDIVFVKGSGSSGPIGFATVRDCQSPPSTSNCNKTDTLIEIDVGMLMTATTQSVTKSIRGQVVKSSTCNDPNNTSYGGMYGIAASGSNVFGFAHGTSANGGSIVQIDNNDGSACLVQASPQQQWDGAAITTVANVVPPTIM